MLRDVFAELIDKILSCAIACPYSLDTDLRCIRIDTHDLRRAWDCEAFLLWEVGSFFSLIFKFFVFFSDTNALAAGLNTACSNDLLPVGQTVQ